jgi:hypothetical protein
MKTDVSTAKNNLLLLFREISAAYSDNHMKPIYKLGVEI